ncbi:MAG: FecR domain-containing protein [Muribaculaceae bacterium]|nr:FecR domain-containing protein [Muribaculaceae bacterium]
MEKDHLYRYFSGAASDEERSRIRRWVEASDENRSRFMSERKFYDIVSMLDADETVSGCARIQQARRSSIRIWVSRMAAAAVAVLITLGVQLYMKTDAVQELPMQQISVPAGQRLNIVLADGTSVWLNSNSTMRFPGAFTGKGRRVEIDGEAYFAVAKDPAHPFTVGTGHGDVRVTGTEFNVDAYKASADFSVSLVKGSVDFAGGDNHVYSLTPGKCLSLTDGGAFAISDVEPETLEWVSGIISFRQLPLSSIIARFEKYYGVSVEMRRPDIADVRFSGKFYLDEGIEQALNTLRHDIRFEYESDKDRRHIIIK